MKTRATLGIGTPPIRKTGTAFCVRSFFSREAWATLPIKTSLFLDPRSTLGPFTPHGPLGASLSLRRSVAIP